MRERSGGGTLLLARRRTLTHVCISFVRTSDLVTDTQNQVCHNENGGISIFVIRVDSSRKHLILQQEDERER